MLDVHPAHHAATTWKDFFIHVATICLGLLIAVGLEQGIEALHRRHQLHELERNLEEETLRNSHWGEFNLASINRDMLWLLELRSRVDALRDGADRKSFIYPQRPDGYPGDPAHTDRKLPAVAVWNTARQNALVNLLPREEGQLYTTFYSVSDLYSDNFTTLTEDWTKLTGFELQFQRGRSLAAPDVTRMSAAQLDQYAAIIDEIYLKASFVRRYLKIQMAYNEDAIHHQTSPNIEHYLQSHPDPRPTEYVFVPGVPASYY
jgi:hypothetical protein